MKPQVIFEDDDILVINKPYGMVVNKADTTRYVETVQEWAESRIKKHESRIMNEDDSEFVKRGGVVHRLDKETSGVLILAKNEQSFVNLQAQFKERKVKKTYITLVHGVVSPADGTIDAKIGRLPWNRTRFGVFDDGRESTSVYHVVANYKFSMPDRKKNPVEDLTLVEVYPASGRTHQIRVHMKHIGHPVFADELYAGRKTARDDRKFLPRQFLHASRISFKHPKTSSELTFEAELPEELSTFLETLHK